MTTDITKTKVERERDQLGESIHEAINIVLRDQGVNFNPRADDLGDEIDDFVELVLDFSAKHNSAHSEENTEEISNG